VVNLANIAEELIQEALKTGVKTIKELHSLKMAYSVKFKITPIPNIGLIEAYKNLVKEGNIEVDKEFEKIIRKRGVRSKSGIASITVITKQFPCPGKCVFCPTEPKMPKSYLSNEPAVMRAILNDFDAYKQTLNRLDGLEKTGHHTDKIDVIISGGTFSFYPKNYQNEFVLGVYNALNYPAAKCRSVIQAQALNEKAEHRLIGLSIETRPDHIDENELKRLRRLGCTKIEIGIQSLNDLVLEKNKRGHTVAETKRALQLMRDAGYKINAHMMPNLYGSNLETDYADFVELFQNPAYRPDWLKIYPCIVVPWSQLEKVYKEGDFKPYSDDELKELLIKIKQIIPRYVRITRLYRDIPATTIVAGSKLSNIRQMIHQEMEKRNIKCNCIRCREIKGEKVYNDKVILEVQEYDASEGKEFFISFNDKEKDKLCSLLRLRFHSYALSGKPHFIKELDGAALIREVHTYGEQVKIAGKTDGTSQHIGLGKRMMIEAENIAKKNGFKKMAVISGIGVREYYRKLGYGLEGTYMVKYF
jgi:elongator complex protein 3